MEIVTRKNINDVYDLLDMTWSGARSVVQRVIDVDRGEELMEWIEELFGWEEVSEDDLNDYLWFELEEEEQWSNLWEDEDDK